MPSIAILFISLFISLHKQECLFHYMPKSSAVVNNYLNKLLFLAQEHGGGTVSKLSTGKGTQTGMFISLYAQVSCSKQLFEQIIIFSSRTWWQHCFKVVHGKGEEHEHYV